MSLIVKTDDVTSGRRDLDPNGRLQGGGSVVNGFKVNDFLSPKQLCDINQSLSIFFFFFLNLFWELLHSSSFFINLGSHTDFPRGSSRVVEDCVTSQKSVCMGSTLF